MTDKEIMQQWLQPGAIVSVDTKTVRILLDALRERLAQPEQKPVVWALPKMHPVMELRAQRGFRVR